MNDRHLNSPYPIRPAPELRSKLEEAARAGGRSLHAEIIQRLERSFETPDEPERMPEPKAIDLLERVVETQSTLITLMLMLEEGVELLENELPTNLRDDPDFVAFINNAEALVYDAKQYLKKQGSTK